MSGVYRLINISLFLAFATLLAVLTLRLSSDPTQEISLPLPPEDPAGGAVERADAAQKSATPRMSGDFVSYESVVNQNLFAADRRPYNDPVAEPTPAGPDPNDVEPEGTCELPMGLQLTGAFVAGATKLAFFNESNVTNVQVGRNGVIQPGAPGGPGSPEAASRLRQRLLQQGRGGQAGQQVPQAMPPGQPAVPGQEGAAEPPKKARHGYREGEQVQGLLIREIHDTKVVLSCDLGSAELELAKEPRLIAGPGPGGAPGRQQPQARQQRGRQQPPQQRPGRRRPPREPAVDVPVDEGLEPADEEVVDEFEDEEYIDEEWVDEEADVQERPVRPGRPVPLDEE